MATAGNTEEAEVKVVLSNGQQAGTTLRELTKQSNKLKASIKDLEPGTQEFIDTARDLKKVKAEYEAIDKEIKEVDEAQKTLNDLMNEYIPFAGQLQKYVKGYGDIKKGVDATGKSMGIMGKIGKAALMGLGIGIVIAALTTLLTWLQKTQAGMDFIGKVTASANAVFQVLIDRVLTFAKAVSALFSGDWQGAVEGLTDTFSGLGKELKEETKAAWEMEGAMQDIVRAEKQLELQRSRTRAEFNRLKKDSEDTSKSEAERLAAAQKAYDIENQLLDQSIKLQTEKLDIIKAQNAQGTSTDEDLNRQYDAEISLEQLRAESYEKQTEIQNKINTLKQSATSQELARIKEQEAAHQKSLEEKAKAEEEYAKKIAKAEDTLKELRIQSLTDEQDQKIAQILLGYERELAAFEGSEDQKIEFAKLKTQEMDAAITAIENENRKKAQDKALADLTTANEIKEAKINELFFSNLISEEERNQQLYDLQVQAAEERLALMVANGETDSAEYAKLYTSLAKLHSEYEEGKTEKAEEEAKKREELAFKGLAAAGQVFGGFAQLLEKDEENRKKNLKTIKALKKAELLANLPLEISNIWTTSQAFGPILGPILAAAQAALAIVRTTKGLADIDKVKYAQGGPVFGPSHAQGGIPFSVKNSPVQHEMEGGEIIMTKGVYQNPTLRAAASMINVAGGGRSFAMGGPVNPLASTVVNPSAPGTVINNISNTTGPTDNQALVSEVQALRADVAAWQTKFEVVLSLQKLHTSEQRIREVDIDTSI